MVWTIIPIISCSAPIFSLMLIFTNVRPANRDSKCSTHQRVPDVQTSFSFLHFAELSIKCLLKILTLKVRSLEKLRPEGFSIGIHRWFYYAEWRLAEGLLVLYLRSLYSLHCITLINCASEWKDIVAVIWAFIYLFRLTLLVTENWGTSYEPQIWINKSLSWF